MRVFAPSGRALPACASRIRNPNAQVHSQIEVPAQRRRSGPFSIVRRTQRESTSLRVDRGAVAATKATQRMVLLTPKGRVHLHWNRARLWTAPPKRFPWQIAGALENMRPD